MGGLSTPGSEVLSDISRHLGGIFRHMLPGVFVVGGAFLAYPGAFIVVDLKSWQHLLVLAVITVTAGNTWFAFNRYGLVQAVDYILYLTKSAGPVPREASWSYLSDLGRYTCMSLHTDDRSARARQHVEFRASAGLLLLTLGELSLVFSFYHGNTSVFKGHQTPLRVAGLAVLAVGFWQMVITRRIDYFMVTGEQ